jgi:hypothetical protein
MDVNSFLESIAGAELSFSFSASEISAGRPPEKMDALFHLPLLALATMVIARNKKSFPTSSLGRVVAQLLIEHFNALHQAPHGLETSITLRRRCAEALAFLEAAGLTDISSDRQRLITLSQNGKSHLDRAAQNETDLGLLVRQLRISQQRVIARYGDER